MKLRPDYIILVACLALIVLCIKTISSLDGNSSTTIYIYKFLLVFACLTAWFKSQALINLKGFPKEGIGDALHEKLGKTNEFLNKNHNSAKLLLIVSSAIIDIFGLFLIVYSILGPSLTPFIALIMVFTLRQVSQCCCSLPAPKGMIWFNPGIPSLFVTYTTTNDFFFSGHTAIAVLGAIVACTMLPWYLAAITIIAAIFEIWTVLALKAHYTMDIIAAILASALSYTLAFSIQQLFVS